MYAKYSWNFILLVVTTTTVLMRSKITYYIQVLEKLNEADNCGDCPEDVQMYIQIIEHLFKENTISTS